jgi:hypothetical protein
MFGDRRNRFDCITQSWRPAWRFRNQVQRLERRFVRSLSFADPVFESHSRWCQGPAPEKVTDRIFEESKKLTEYKIGAVPKVGVTGSLSSRFANAQAPQINLSVVQSHKFVGTPFEVEVIDSAADYIEVLRECFDFDTMRRFAQRGNFHMLFDSMNGGAPRCSVSRS